MNDEIRIFVPFMSGFGGTETVIKNLFTEYKKEFPSRNNLILISIGGYENDEWIKNISNKKVIQLNFNKIFRTLEYLLVLPFLLFKEIHNSNTSTVISTNPVMWMLLYWIKKIFHYDYEVISWYHYSLKEKPVRSFILKSADRYLAISTGIAKQIVSYGVDASKIKIIFNPVMNTNITVPRSLKKNQLHFLYVGRIMLDGQKNLRDLITALSNFNSNWTLDIYGQGEKSKVQDFIREKGLENNIFLQGFKANLWESLTSIDFLFLTSKFEGFPMVLNEAISVGIPVISYNCETGPEDIVKDNNGFLVYGCNEVDLTKTIEKAAKKIKNFTNTQEIKDSISKFYSQHFLTVFLQAVRNSQSER